MVYPKSMKPLKTAVQAAMHRFNVSEEHAFLQLLSVLLVSHARKNPTPTTAEGDIEITCAICADEQWWHDNYGGLWEWARWWHCGPLGLDCGPNP